MSIFSMILAVIVIVFLFTFVGLYLVLDVYNKGLEAKERKKRIDILEKRIYTKK